MNPTPFTLILTGRSGSGKGTQAELLMNYFNTSTSAPSFHIESGAWFREFITGSLKTNELSNDVSKRAGLQPEFLSIWMWADFLIKHFTGKEHLIFDGVPRKIIEAQALTSALDFYGREKVYCIDLEVSPTTSLDRLRLRGRLDDKKDADIQNRLSWFETEVMSVIELYKNDSRYTYACIDGEKTPEEVHVEILKIVGI